VLSGRVVVAAMLAGGVLLLFLASLLTLRYRITEEALEVLVLGRRVRRVRLDDIEEVHRRGALIHESWVGAKFWNAVTVRRRSGWLRNFVISPDDPDRFAADLRDRLPGAPR
jgi:hypothetical protein